MCRRPGRVGGDGPVEKLIELRRGDSDTDGQDQLIVRGQLWVKRVVHHHVGDGMIQVGLGGIDVDHVGAQQLDAVGQSDAVTA